jgi:hypothetical protein
MSDNTDKFGPGGPANTSTVLSSQLPGTVNLTNCSGKVIHNSAVGSNAQVAFTTSFTCTQGACVIGAEFTGDATSKPKANSMNFTVGGKTNSVTGKVTRIVGGPGLYVSNNGDGIVTVSLEPLRRANETENLQQIVWTQSDNTLPYDTSCFIAVGGGAGAAGQVPPSGVIVRSRDGDNWVDLNNKPYEIGLTNVVAIESKDILTKLPSGIGGTGQIYFSGAYYYNYPINTQFIGLYNIFGIEGKTDQDSCAWCSDGLTYRGSEIKQSGASIPGLGNGNNWCFYNTGSIVTNSLFLTSTFYSPGVFNGTGAAILRYTDFPVSLVDNDVTPDSVPAVQELFSTGSSFYEADSNLLDNSFNSYKIMISDRFGKKIWASNRSGKSAGTWASVYSAPEEMFGMTYCGGGRWVACGKNDTILVSTNNGSSWTSSPSKWAGSWWRSAASGHGYIVVVGFEGRAVYSQDGGVTWQRAQTGTTKDLRSVAFSPKLCQFAAVGNSRTIIKVAV